MGGIEIDLTEYEDPAPKDPSHGPQSEQPASRNDDRIAKNRRLPFRATVEVGGRRYRGTRASRADLELDTDTLGLIESDDEFDRMIDGDKHEGDDVDEASEDESLEGSESDEDALEEHGKRDAIRRLQELNAGERAVVQRLAKAEEDDLRKARAVKRQRDTYDTLVDMRIKLEKLMAHARTFPSITQRRESAAWEENKELSEAMSSAEGAGASLTAQAEKIFRTIWPYDSESAEDGKEFSSWRNGILDEWGKRVNEAEGIVPKGGFKAIDTSVSAQMKASLESGKYLARTRRVREPISLVGGPELKQGTSDMHYDDGELYRMLLRDIIESGDGAGGGLRYAQLSKGGRIKKKRDRTFAKGKRLKYDVHEKLVGFLAPVPLPEPGPVDEIIASLFGRMGTVGKVVSM